LSGIFLPLVSTTQFLDAGQANWASNENGGFFPMNDSARSIYEFSAPLPDGRTTSLEQFRGQALLIVNTASQCGFTPQFADLEQLYRTYHERGFAVLGFPCNQFGAQEPGSEAEIGAYCQKNFGVSFPLFAKIEVNGPQAHPLYRFLKDAKRGFLGSGAIKWNFTKFLVDRQGRVVGRWASATSPATLSAKIESLLDSPAELSQQL
jgi:glutathione peroxidase